MKKMLENLSTSINPYWFIGIGALLSFFGTYLVQIKSDAQSRINDYNVQFIKDNISEVYTEIFVYDSAFTHSRKELLEEGKLGCGILFHGAIPLKNVEIKITDYGRSMCIPCQDARPKDFNAEWLTTEKKFDFIFPEARYYFPLPVDTRIEGSLLFEIETTHDAGQIIQRLYIENYKSDHAVIKTQIWNNSKEVRDDFKT